MAVTTTTRSVSYTATGAETEFAVPFRFLEDSHLVVELDGVAKTLGLDYTVQGAAGSSGTVVPVGSFVGELVIRRVVPLTQVVSLRGSGNFSPPVHEAALDLAAMQAQQLDQDRAELAAELVAESAARQAVSSQTLAAVAALSGQAHTADSLSSVLAFGSSNPRTLAARFGEQVNVKDFGATGDGVTDDTAAIQAAIDHAIYTAKIGRVYLPDGEYKITNTLHLGYGTDYRHVELHGAGRCYGGNRGLFGGTAIKPTFSDRMAINLQGLRQATLSSFTLIGKNNDFLVTQAAVIPATWKPDKASWLDPTLHANADSRYAPYAGICIDGYAGVGTNVPRYPNVTYPAFLGSPAQFGKNTSGRFVIQDVEISGFVVGVVTQPNGSDSNGDFLTILNSDLVSNLYNLSVSHSQSRNVNAINCRLSGAWKSVVTAVHGAQVGQLGGDLVGCCFDSCYQAFDMKSAYGSVHVVSAYAERLIRLGSFHGGASGDRPVKFTQCNFNFEVEDNGPQVATHLDAGAYASVILDSCSLGTGRGFSYSGDLVEFRGTFTPVGGAGYWNTTGLGICLSMNAQRGVLPQFGTFAYRRRLPMSLKSKVTANVDGGGASGGIGLVTDLETWNPHMTPPTGASGYKRSFPFPAWAVPQLGEERLLGPVGVDFNRNGIVFTRSGLDYSFDASAIRTAGSKAAATFGIGDLVVDLATGAKFFVSNIVGATVTLTQLSGYQKVAGVFSPMTGADITVNSNTNMVVHAGGRVFCHQFAMVGDFTAGSAVITNVRRILDDLTPVTVASAVHGWEALEGDMLLSSTEVNTQAAHRIVMSNTSGGAAAVIAAGGLATPGQVTMSKNALRTATEVPINFWLRKPA